MSRRFGQQQIDLQQALTLLAPKPLPAATYTEQILANFGCSHRAAADTIAILKRAHYIQQHTPATGDRRHKTYSLTQDGHHLLTHPNAARLLRHARKLLTTCPSPRTRRTRQTTLPRHPETEFERRQHILLNQTAPTAPPPATTTPEPTPKTSTSQTKHWLAATLGQSPG
jgi:hypothetical protein